MPLTHKGKEIEHAEEKEYGEKKGKEVFYASINKGSLKGAECKHCGSKHHKSHEHKAKGKALKKHMK